MSENFEPRLVTEDDLCEALLAALEVNYLKSEPISAKITLPDTQEEFSLSAVTPVEFGGRDEVWVSFEELLDLLVNYLNSKLIGGVTDAIKKHFERCGVSTNMVTGHISDKGIAFIHSHVVIVVAIEDFNTRH